MSQVYISAAVAILASLLPLLGFQVENSEILTQNISNIITLAAGAWALYSRVRMGDIHWTGIRKYQK